MTSHFASILRRTAPRHCERKRSNPDLVFNSIGLASSAAPPRNDGRLIRHCEPSGEATSTFMLNHIGLASSAAPPRNDGHLIRHCEPSGEATPTSCSTPSRLPRRLRLLAMTRITSVIASGSEATPTFMLNYIEVASSAAPSRNDDSRRTRHCEPSGEATPTFMLNSIEVAASAAPPRNDRIRVGDRYPRPSSPRVA